MADSKAGRVAYDATREVRFAVVLYGGVSLAIYINGVVRELLNLVRATAPGQDGGLHQPEPTSPVIDVYRELGRRLVEGRLTDDAGAPVRTRFVVDIITGTSAGGINGVVLAKALACDLDLTELDNLWVREADIAGILNDRASETALFRNERPPGALMSSRRMQYMLLRALRDMNGAPDGRPSPYADAIDLFVTATDLAGRQEEVNLTDHPAGPVREVVHRTVFRFIYGRKDAIGGDEDVNQFTRAYDPMLAFAARATSSFPGAFEPTCLDDLTAALNAVYTDGLDGVAGPDSADLRRYFFARYGDAAYRSVYLADGGYLDNKPFEAVLDALPHRRADLPVDRKLLYIEPDPGRPPLDASGTRPDMIDAVIKVASTPRVETIGNDVSRIRSFGDLAASRKRVYQEVEQAIDEAIHGTPVPGVPTVTSGRVAGVTRQAAPGAQGAEGAEGAGVGLAQRRDLEAHLRARVDAVVAGAPTHAAYMELRAARTVRDIAEVLARIVYDKQYDRGSAVHMALEQAAKTWRVETGIGRDELLRDYDLRFALDRINFVQARIRARLRTTPADRPQDTGLLRKLGDAYAELRGRGRAIRLSGDGNPAWAAIGDLRRRLQPAGDPASGTAEAPAGQPGALPDPAHVLATSPEAWAAFGRVVTALKDHMDLESSEAAQRELLAGTPLAGGLLDDWAFFSCYDEAVGPLRDELPGENDAVEVHRISPDDTRSIVADPSRNPKLAGAAVHHFGGFFHEDWRRNDILWGRLDAAERIITVLVPEPSEQRDHLVERAQTAILDELLADDGWRDWLSRRFDGTDVTTVEADRRARAVRSALADQPCVGTAPEPAATLVLGARAARVSGSLVDGLADHRQPASGLRWIGRALRLVANIAELLIPGRMKALLWQRTLVLLIVAGGVMTVGGVLLGLEQVRTAGIVTIGAALAIRFASDAAVRRLEGGPLWSTWAAWVLRTVVGVLIALAFLGANALARRDDGWQFALLGLVPAAVVLLPLVWMAWRLPEDAVPGRVVTWRRIGYLALALVVAVGVTLAVVAVADWSTTWASFKSLIGTD